jgi:cobalamin synthase
MKIRSLLVACVLAIFCLMPLTGCAPSDGGADSGDAGSSNTTASE